jgi:hypothetical protein
MGVNGQMMAMSHSQVIEALYFPLGHVDEHGIAIAPMLFKMFCSVL